MPESNKKDFADRISNFIRPAYRLTGDGCFLSWQQRDAVQGFMIVVIILAHAYRVMKMPTLEAFHDIAYESPLMLAFLCLPLLNIVKPATAARLKDLFVRYYVPYAVFLTALTFYAWYTRYGGRSWDEQFMLWATAMLKNNYESTGDVAYSSYLWFMPAFLLFQFMLALYYALSNRMAVLAFLALLVGLAFIGQGEGSWAANLPFTFATVVYTLPLSIIIAHILNRMQHIRHRYIAGLVCVAIYIALTALTRSWDSSFIIYFAQFYTVLQFDEFATHIVRSIFGSVSILMLAPLLEKVFVFRWVGQNVLIMYMGHLPIMRMVDRLARNKLGLDPSDFLTGTLIIVVTMLLTAAVAKGIAASSWLSAFITPRNITHYKEAFGIKPAPSTATR